MFWAVNVHVWLARRGPKGRFRDIGGARGEDGVELTKSAERNSA